MKVGVFSNIHSAAGGGGTAYITAWGHALQAFGDVELYTRRPVKGSEIEAAYGMPLTGIEVKITPERTPGPGRRMMQAWTDRRYGVIVRQSTEVPGPTGCRRGVLLTEFPFQKQMNWRERLYLGTYAEVVANSAFTASWIEKRWQRRAQFVYPPVRPVPAAPKERIIAAVGRFTGGPRGKYQLEMVGAFRELQQRLRDPWELHLCGFEQAPAYVAEVRAAASGLPVEIHLNGSRAEVERVLGRAAIFWHATGAAFAESERPECMEHFGISVAEAMSAGCVPVVVGRGGLLEVVGPALRGWTWQTWEECVNKTLTLAGAGSLLSDLSRQAQTQASTFYPEKFRNRVGSFVSSLLSDGEKAGRK